MFRKSFILLVFVMLMIESGAGVAASTRAAATGQANHNANACTPAQGQLLIEQGQYEDAILVFTCLIDAQPTEVEGYRGRIEAEVLLGRYSDAVRDYQRVMAFVLPVHPEAEAMIMAGYDARLAAAPDDFRALTGASSTLWWFYHYASAIHVLNHLLDLRPNDVYGNLFRGSSRFLLGATKAKGAEDLERALTLAPQSAHVRFIVADAYTYGQPDLSRAFVEASLALAWGLDTPRVHAILGACYLSFGNLQAAAAEIRKHIELVTTEYLLAPPLSTGGSLELGLVPARTYEIPIAAMGGETVSIRTSSRDFKDTIMVLLAPDGTPVVGNDDFKAYYAGFDWVASATGAYRLQVTSFESVSTGVLVVTRN